MEGGKSWAGGGLVGRRAPVGSRAGVRRLPPQPTHPSSRALSPSRGGLSAMKLCSQCWTKRSVSPSWASTRCTARAVSTRSTTRDVSLGWHGGFEGCGRPERGEGGGRRWKASIRTAIARTRKAGHGRGGPTGGARRPPRPVRTRPDPPAPHRACRKHNHSRCRPRCRQRRPGWPWVWRGGAARRHAPGDAPAPPAPLPPHRS